MVRITMDHSAMVMGERDPVIKELNELDAKEKITIYNTITLDRELEELTESEGKMYESLREMVFGKEQKHLNLTEHGDLVLLVNHMKNKRDFFLTFDEKRYENLSSHRELKVRFPDKEFLKEVSK
jgi:hypothetical protein